LNNKSENSGREIQYDQGHKREHEESSAAAIRRTKRVIIPVDFNEEADLEQAGDVAMREFMLMQ
jgi:hypothetical protein